MEEKIVQLKISLKSTSPPIWRRVLVKSSISFYELHHTIQLSMDWSNYHLYEFNVDNYRIGVVEEEFEDFGFGNSELVDAEEVTLEEMLSKGIKRFTYEYDFGDGWEHTIEIEKTVPFEPGAYYPVCIKGKMKCPPEDCGGIPGFYELLEIANDKKHPEHFEMMEWLGGEFDPFEFDIEKVNFRLENIEDNLEGLFDMEDEMFLDPKVKIVNKSSHKLPEYETEASAGMDLRANIPEAITLKPLERSIVKTGLFIELPLGYEAQVRPRSGLAAKKGITVLNSPGTIDADYRGEIGVILVNLSNEEFTIENGERIAQLVVARHERIIWNEVDSLSETSRGTGGFGSTGTN